jgi:mRNA m6A methyltransferase non-catalytic subunit
MSTAEVLSSAHELLDAHYSLLERTRSTQRANRRALRAYAANLPASGDQEEGSSSLNTLLNLPLLQTPPRSPTSDNDQNYEEDFEEENVDITKVVASVVRPHPREVRADLPPAKKARCARYENYVPEEETIRNDYCQRYVDGGEWPQNWVVGAEMERRFEE